MSATMSREMDQWLFDRTPAVVAARLACAAPGRPEKKSLVPEWAQAIELTDAEWEWLWPQFRALSLPMLGFARRLQSTAGRAPAMSLEQRRWVLTLAYKYRRRIFGRSAAGVSEADFVSLVRRRAG